jgi:hypothetical protein
MAVTALFPIATLVTVVIFMTAITVFRQRFFQHAGAVTAIAAGGVVGAEQGKVSFFVVVEFGLVPLCGCMTVVTAQAVTALVYVLYLVAADTRVGSIFILLVDMAGVAAGFFVRAFQWKFCFFVMVKRGVFPADCIMTVATFFALLAFVDIIFFVA